MGNDHLCSWRSGPILSSSLRKIMQHPHRILEPYLFPGMTVMDVGCGMGFFTIPMSEMVGEAGRVIAVDLQQEMLEGLKNRAESAGRRNITSHLCGADSLGVEPWNGTVDFALIFMMLHEAPDAERLIREISAALTPHGTLLFAEPVMHVNKQQFRLSLRSIKDRGYREIAAPRITFCRATVCQKM